jgi:hypothetical protein
MHGIPALNFVKISLPIRIATSDVVVRSFEIENFIKSSAFKPKRRAFKK